MLLQTYVVFGSQVSISRVIYTGEYLLYPQAFSTMNGSDLCLYQCPVEVNGLPPLRCEFGSIIGSQCQTDALTSIFSSC